jgi:hypothetical protein
MEGTYNLSLAVAHCRQFKCLLSAPPPANAANEGEPIQQQSEVTDPVQDGQAQGDSAPARAAEPQPQAEPGGGGVSDRAGGGATYPAGAAA